MFRFNEDKPEHISLQYKHRSTEHWLPTTEQDGLELVKLDATGHQILHFGKPQSNSRLDQKQSTDSYRKSIAFFRNK